MVSITCSARSGFDPAVVRLLMLAINGASSALRMGARVGIQATIAPSHN